MSSESPEQLALQAVVSGRYSLIREIGRGGMGVVFLATDVALERRVAIKLLLPHLARDEAVRARFFREAKTAAQLMHPNIVPLHSVEEHDDLLFFVMSYVDGETLTDRVRRLGRLSGDDAVRLVQELAWALSYAHAQGIVHRDIKPDNILIERGSGRALITDFGIARVASRETLSEPGAFVGTLHYMSPEQALGEQVDGRSDLYSLGGTAFFATTGHAPIEGETLPVLLTRLQRDVPPSVATHRSDLSPVLVEAIGRCLRKAASERYEKAEQLALALRDAQAETAAVPVEIRMLIRQLSLASALVAVGAGGALVLVPIMVVAGTLAGADAAGAAAMAGLVGLIGVAGVVGQILHALRRGLRLEDFDAPLKLEADRVISERKAYLERAFDARGLRLNRGMALIGMGAGVLFGSAAMVLALYGLPEKRPAMLFAGTVMYALGAWSAWTLRYFKRNARPPEWYLTGGIPVAVPLRVLRWVLRTPIARRLFGAIHKETAPAGFAAPAVPTATLLVRRVEELLKEIPASMRGILADVPALASRLEDAIQALRDRLSKLDAAMAEVGADHPSHADFAAARTATTNRLSQATSALETLRADLLRLQAGVMGADGITADLERVRELGMAIDAELFGLDSARAITAHRS